MSTHQAAKQLDPSRETIQQGTWLLLIGIVLLGANLRAPLTSVGPLVASIRDSLHLSNTSAGALTAVPLLAFAFLSPFAPKLSQRFGLERTLFASLLLLTFGIAIRSTGGMTTLFTGTILLGLAISVSNVLLPSLIKRDFAKNIGVMTGIYAVSMNLCGAIATGVSVPLSSLLGLGWRGALGCWGVLSLLAIFFWIPQLKQRSKVTTNAQTTSEKSINLWRSHLAWQVTFFMGLQSLIFYTVITWLPEILKEQGLHANEAGWMLSIMQFALLPFTFIVPIWAGRLQSQCLLVALTAGLFLSGLSGILYGSTQLTLLWVILIGIGGGFAFSLAMMFFSLRTQSTQEAAELSGMAQSLGYLLAATGPVLFGWLHDITHSWTIPLLMLIVISIFIFIFGMGAGKKGYVK
ncbi:CynX/NimT family MFS transporter [Bacillus sp. FJAT-42315]|uniref:CynX/NimT family MFS transporter n=1 Tax=Bacillus sp. FJAT-42315 TaxID=2014077 RepID=UPI000C2490D9|nr:MFS transporter [Bacillus sp. FJAT-42315]